MLQRNVAKVIGLKIKKGSKAEIGRIKSPVRDKSNDISLNKKILKKSKIIKQNNNNVSKIVKKLKFHS